MRHRAPVALGVMMVMLFGMTSCDKPDKKTTISLLEQGAKIAAQFGLKKWAEKDAPGATECAKTLKTNISDVLLPYLNGDKLPVSSEVQAFIQSSLFKDVKPEVKDAIVMAAIALDAVLPVPDASTKLNQDQIDYIKSFLTGVVVGCDKFLSKDISKPNNWIK